MLDSVINPVHLLIILAIVVVLFGPKRLPEMGQKLGQALRDLRTATS
jgi:sec-independent protein translocase protein TatA